MIFPQLNIENIIQIKDTIRLDATRSFVSKDEASISLIEIEPEAGAGFIDVTGTKSKDWFLDWQYSGASRTVTITVRVTTDGAPVASTFDLEVISKVDDKLFSTDADLFGHETDILKFLPDGKTSFNYMHRRAQKLIVEDFNERGVTDYDRQKLTKDAFVDVDEVRDWSIALTLALIFEDNSNVVGDTFSVKAEEYNSAALRHRNRAFFRVDLNGDGTIDTGEAIPYQTKDIVRS